MRCIEFIEMRHSYRAVPLILLLILSIMLCPNAAAQDNGEDTDNNGGVNIDGLDNGEAVPYSKDEFPTWAQDLRRSEIITLGSLPFTVLATTLCYSLVRYTAYGFDFSYVPNPFAKSGAGSLDTSEQIGVVAAAGGLSICIGLTDLFIHIARRKKQKRLELLPPPITINPVEEEENTKEQGTDTSGKGTGDSGGGTDEGGSL